MNWFGFGGVNTFTNSPYGSREGEMAVVLEMAPADGSYLMAHADKATSIPLRLFSAIRFARLVDRKIRGWLGLGLC